MRILWLKIWSFFLGPPGTTSHDIALGERLWKRDFVRWYEHGKIIEISLVDAEDREDVRRCDWSASTLSDGDGDGARTGTFLVRKDVRDTEVVRMVRAEMQKNQQ